MSGAPIYLRRAAVLAMLGLSKGSKRVLARLEAEGHLKRYHWGNKGWAYYLRSEVQKVLDNQENLTTQ